MALISSNSLTKEAPKLSAKIADKDITRVNEAGQTVLVVPKGQRIPANLEEAASDTVPVRQAEESAESKKASSKPKSK
jgi:hypothetical protein